MKASGGTIWILNFTFSVFLATMNAKYNYYVGARSNLQEGEGAVQSTLHLAPGCVVYICCVLKKAFFCLFDNKG